MTNNNVKTSEYISYGVGGLGKGAVGGMVATFALIYFTDVVGIIPVVAGAVITVSKILVMLALPIAGVKMDGTRTKYGRFRPYLLWFSFVMGIITSLLFVSPTLYGLNNDIGKIVLVFFAYLLWELSFNLHDIPYWSIASVCSGDEDTRSKMLSVANIVTTVGGVAPIISVPYLTEAFGNTMGYLYGGLIFGLTGAVICTVVFFGTKERIEIAEAKPMPKDILRALFKNKYLLIFDIGLIISATVFSASSGATYIGKYIYGIQNGNIVYPNGQVSFFDEGVFLTVIIIVLGGGSLVSDAIFPVFFNKLGLKKTFVTFAIIGACLSLVMYFVGYKNFGVASLYILLVYLLILGFLQGIFESLKSNLIPESADYTEWMTGKRIDGTLFSVQVTVSQIIESVPIMIVAIILQIVGYVEPGSEDIIIEQSESVKNGIFAIATLAPCIGLILGIIPILFYKYNGKYREKILSELKDKRNNKENNHAS